MRKYMVMYKPVGFCNVLSTWRRAAHLRRTRHSSYYVLAQRNVRSFAYRTHLAVGSHRRRTQPARICMLNTKTLTHDTRTHLSVSYAWTPCIHNCTQSPSSIFSVHKETHYTLAVPYFKTNRTVRRLLRTCVFYNVINHLRVFVMCVYYIQGKYVPPLIYIHVYKYHILLNIRFQCRMCDEVRRGVCSDTIITRLREFIKPSLRYQAHTQYTHIPHARIALCLHPLHRIRILRL